jgi:hypothetical protein
MIYVLLDVGGTSPTDLGRGAKRGSLGPQSPKEGRGGLGDSRATPVEPRGWGGANRGGCTYPF